MGKTQKCSWITLLPEVIFGAEDDDDKGGKGGESEGGSKEDDDEGAGGTEDDDSKEHDDKDDPKTKGLRSALATERANAKAALKKANLLQKEKDERELADKTEVEQVNIKLTKAEERNGKLAAGLLKTRLDSAIEKAARAAKFLDPDDVIGAIDRASITFEQDDDDPSDITIDQASIDKAVKDLATKKPHWISTGTEDGEETGSKFGGTRRKSKDTGKTREQELQEIYPTLR